MRRVYARSHRSGAETGLLAVSSQTLSVAARRIHRRHSPDRTHSEQVQDRQNAFHWAAHHIFRPHQHFTYDPTSWSRPLEEKAKKARTLSLVERVRAAAEREEESTGNAAALLHRHRSTPDAAHDGTTAPEPDTPDYFYAAAELSSPSRTAPAAAAATEAAPPPPPSEWSAVTLQELVQEVQRLQQLLLSPRYAGNTSLQRRAHQHRELRATLLQLYIRLRDAQLGVTVTPDACAFGWFLLMRSLEPLIEALGGDAAAEAVRDVFAALRAGVLLPMAEGGQLYTAAASRELSLVALIELLSIATAPFVWRCAAHFADERGAVSDPTLLRYAELVSVAARERARDTADDDSEQGGACAQEWLDPLHVEAWATAVRRLHTRGVPVLAAVPGLELHVEHAAVYVAQLLETATAVPPSGHVTASLARRGRCSETPAAALSPQQRDAAPKPVCLDLTAAPHGVQRPPTECGDVAHIIVAATAVLHLEGRAAGAAPRSEESARRSVVACLRLLTHAPNFDLSADGVVAWASAVLHAGHLLDLDGDGGGGGGGSRPALRFAVLLSRISYGAVVDRVALGEMVLRLCRVPEPAHADTRETREWRRLRGVVMHGALRVLRVPDLEAAAVRLGSQDPAAWLETLAYGEFGGAVPMELWREAAVRLFPEVRYHIGSRDGALAPAAAPAAPRPCSTEAAQALCVLCSRYVAQGTKGAPPTNLLCLFTARCVGECLAVMFESPGLVQSLLRSADAWDGLCASLPERVRLVATCMQEVVRRETPSAKVLSY
ncbi:hypothetical protein NESM_000786200 [Novymonas esmeraldas]|uniref:Uncharacterized protein n=1 Tax=Novymonas esmeraldas TaxID=1808958 RepID=A0AAW0EVL9_9TRYP